MNAACEGKLRGVTDNAPASVLLLLVCVFSLRGSDTHAARGTGKKKDGIIRLRGKSGGKVGAFFLFVPRE